MKKIISLGLVLGAFPFFVFATGDVGSIIFQITGYINLIVPVLITVAIGYFIWGVIQFISSSEEEAKKNGRTKIINGLIGLFVIVAFWGIIAVVRNTFGITDSSGTAGSDVIILP
ncbi:MAG: hypothetical protein WC908_00800 [Candidatus Paceibacterota bacterium]